MAFREERFAEFSAPDRSILFRSEALENLGRYRIDGIPVKLEATRILLSAWLDGAMTTASTAADAERLGAFSDLIDEMGRVARENFPMPERREGQE